MEFGDLSDDVRYGIAFVAILAVGVAIGEAIVVMRFDDVLLFLVPVFLIIVGGIVWDRIYLHDQTL